jgi:hypothetical protein
MAFKLIRRANVVTAANTADDAQHTVDLGKLSGGAAFRVSEFGGQDVFFKITNEGTAVTSTNGIFLRAGQSVIVVAEGAGADVGLSAGTTITDCPALKNIPFVDVTAVPSFVILKNTS